MRRRGGREGFRRFSGGDTATVLSDNAFGSRYFLDGSDEIRLLWRAVLLAEGRGLREGAEADEMSDTDRPNHRQCPFGSWN